jgi:hypothetical protein
MIAARMDYPLRSAILLPKHVWFMLCGCGGCASASAGGGRVGSWGGSNPGVAGKAGSFSGALLNDTVAASAVNVSSAKSQTK